MVPRILHGPVPVREETGVAGLVLVSATLAARVIAHGAGVNDFGVPPPILESKYHGPTMIVVQDAFDVASMATSPLRRSAEWDRDYVSHPH